MQSTKYSNTNNSIELKQHLWAETDVVCVEWDGGWVGGGGLGGWSITFDYDCSFTWLCSTTVTCVSMAFSPSPCPQPTPTPSTCTQPSPALPCTSGKTSNGNLVLSQIIFDNPNDDTYFRGIMSNLRSISAKKLYLHKEQQRYQCATQT
jgi:hypothetical protein